MKLRVALVAALLVAGVSPLALADDAAGTAEQRYREGMDAFRHWRFEDARAALVQAYSLDPQPRYLWNLAVCEAKSNHPVEALAHFKHYFLLPQATEQDRQTAAPYVADSQSKTGHVTVDAPLGAVIWVDDSSEAMTAPLRDAIDVAPGAHVIRGRIGTQVVSAEAHPQAGETVRVELPFELARAPEVKPLAPPSPVPVAPVLASASPAPSGARWIVAGSVGGVGVASLLTGVVFFVAASGKATTWHDLQATAGSCSFTSPMGACADLRNAANAHARDENIGVTLVSVGAALVAGGVATALLWSNDKTTADMIVPIVAPHGGGAQWVHTF